MIRISKPSPAVVFLVLAALAEARHRATQYAWRNISAAPQAVTKPMQAAVQPHLESHKSHDSNSNNRLVADPEQKFCDALVDANCNANIGWEPESSCDTSLNSLGADPRSRRPTALVCYERQGSGSGGYVPGINPPECQHDHSTVYCMRLSVVPKDKLRTDRSKFKSDDDLTLVNTPSRGRPPDCGPLTAPRSSIMPNVLLIGDSISMGTGNDTYSDGTYVPLGYGWDVQSSLEPVGLAAVQHNGGWFLAGQAGASSHGVECIDHWLGTNGTWDVVHINFGLHDVDAGEFVPPENYTQNLDYIYGKIQAKLTKHGQMIWGSTSPVPYPSEYKVRKPQQYSQAADSHDC
eukprot:SAG31_NODE_2687_length_5245_cov_1.854676_4_plen_348_part_00